MEHARVSQKTRRVPRLLVVLLLMLTLSGCQFTVSTNAVVEEGGSGTVTSSVLVDAELQANALQNGEDIPTALRTLFPAELPPGSEVEDVSRDGLVGIEVKTPFASTAELQLIMLPENGNSLFQTFTLQEDSGGYVLEAVAAPGGMSSAQEVQAAQLVEVLRSDFSITLPGEVGENNADRVEGNTLYWTLASDAERALEARTEGGTSPVLIVLAGVVVLALGYLYWRYRQGTLDAAVAPVRDLVQKLTSGRTDKSPTKDQGPGRGGSGAPRVSRLEAGRRAAMEQVPLSLPPESRTTDEEDDLDMHARYHRDQGMMGPERMAQEHSLMAAEAPQEPQAAASPTQGWYPDPAGTNGYRWYDGAQWTEHVRDDAPLA